MNQSETAWQIAEWKQRPGTPAVFTRDPAQLPAPSEYETVSGLLGVLRRRWVAIALVLASMIILGVLACFVITPRYSSTATLQVKPEDHDSSGSPQTSFNADELKSEIETDISVIQSDGMAVSVIEALGLADKPPFRSAIIPSEKGRPLDHAPKTRERMVEMFKRYVKVDSPADTRLINITVQNPDAQVAAQIANGLAERFIQESLERQHRSTSQSSYWLQQELADLKNQVEVSEKKLADYESKTGLAGVQLNGSTTTDGGSSVEISPHNPVTERLFALSQELTSAEANRISTETVYRLVRTHDPELVLGLGSMSVSNGSGSSGGSLTADSGIELVRSLRTQEASLNREYAGYAVKYGTNNPRLAEVQQQIVAVKQQMEAELQRISQRAENAYLYAKQNEASIREQLTKQQTEANLLNDKTIQLQVLGQEAYSNRALYESLFSKLQSASLAAGTRPSRIDLVDVAPPAGSPSVPNIPKVMAAFTGGGLLLGMLCAFARESFDQTVRTVRDLGEVPKLDMLAFVPRYGLGGRSGAEAGQSVLIDTPTAPFSEAFRSLRTSILLSFAGRPMKTLLVTSATKGDGKTTVVYNLGVAFAQQGAKVLLIDGDLRNPHLHESFGAPRSPGLSEFLCREHGGEPEVIRHSKLENLFLLPAGALPELASELVGSNRFQALLQGCEPEYDYVLIDSPPMMAVTDAAIIATNADAVLAVVRSHRTTRSLLAGLAQALERTQVSVLGLVLNDVQNPSQDGLYGVYGYGETPENRRTLNANS
jgi:succinoglycan biosynthesis transport protein ExoP